MKLSRHALEVLCEIAIKAARQAGQMIQARASTDVTVLEKLAGSSPASQIVTEVDYASQEIILNGLRPTLEEYDLGLLIEESEDDLSRFEKDYFWCIDPLDGTLPFVEKRPGYSVSIALVSREGKSCVGVVYDPLPDVLYHAVSGSGAFRNHAPWVLDSTYVDRYETIVSGGAVMNACWALEHAPAFFGKRPKVEQGGGCLWDYAATACLFEEIGAVVSDSSGRPLALNSKESLYMNQRGVMYATHQEIAAQMFNA